MFNLVHWLILVIESLGVVLVAIGVIVTIYLFIKASPRMDAANFRRLRRVLARFLQMALEFQLAADIISTAITPSWEQLGKLAVVAAIRTGLNFYLIKETRDDER